jgi:hypothetical protein
MSNNRYSCRICVIAAVAFAGLVVVAQGTVPRGWYLQGSNPKDFAAGVDLDQAYQGHASAFLKSKELRANGFGTLMQTIKAEQYLGRKVRLSGLVKSQEVKGWAALWMRLDKGTTMVAFDNMEKRPIKGTTDWQRYDVELDVPKDATAISFGILLDGPGEVWLNGTRFEAPDIGDRLVPEKPVNLDFAE